MEDKSDKKMDEHSGHHTEHHSEHHHTHPGMERKSHSKKTFTDKMRKNPWMVSTFVLAILVIAMLVFGSLGSSVGGKTVSKDEAGQSLVDFANAQGANAQLVGVNDSGIENFYEVTLSIQGQNLPIYVSKDGQYFTSSLIPLAMTTPTNTDTSSQTTEVPKTDKPVVELFIWGYCPYGVQAQEPLADVANLLGNYADFKAVLYYAGHGDHEAEQNKIQECIQQIAPDKYWDYAKSFVETIYPKCGPTKDIDCDKTESTKLMNSLGIDSTAVFNCVDTQGDELQTAAAQRASELGVTGSPTLVINGVKTNTARTADAFKQAICDAFTNGTAPAACSTELNSTATAASGNC